MLNLLMTNQIRGITLSFSDGFQRHSTVFFCNFTNFQMAFSKPPVIRSSPTFTSSRFVPHRPSHLRGSFFADLQDFFELDPASVKVDLSRGSKPYGLCNVNSNKQARPLGSEDRIMNKKFKGSGTPSFETGLPSERSPEMSAIVTRKKKKKGLLAFRKLSARRSGQKNPHNSHLSGRDFYAERENLRTLSFKQHSNPEHFPSKMTSTIELNHWIKVADPLFDDLRASS